MNLVPNGTDANNGELLEGSTPRNIAGLRSLVTVRERIEIDAQLRYQSRIESMPLDVTAAGIDAYTEIDLRLGWRVSDHWVLSIVGQNLLHDSHPEFGPAEARGNLERAGYFKAEWRH
jgi:iron complex outermembrane receptor protein